MTKLVWDQADQSRYEAGVDRGVFYPSNGPGVVWNGLVSVQESPSDADERTRYVDGLRTRTGRRPGEFSGTIEAFTYPESFYEIALAPKIPKPFGMSYRVKTSSSYLIHLVYNVRLAPSGFQYESQEASTYNWPFTTKPAAIPGAKPSAHLIINVSDAYSSTVENLENVLYGSNDLEAGLPQPVDLLDIFEANSILRIIDNEDGTWTAIGPDNIISMVDSTTFQIDYPTATYLNTDTYTIHSL